jgi:hypothetical protein
MAARYSSGVLPCARARARRACGDAIEKSVFEHRDDIRASRCQHHYVFFVRDYELGTLILAVLQEKMALLERLRQRLGWSGLLICEQESKTLPLRTPSKETRYHPP